MLFSAKLLFDHGQFDLCGLMDWRHAKKPLGRLSPQKRTHLLTFEFFRF
jgi:hypothetical protein